MIPPDLKDSDSYFCCCVRRNLTNKEMLTDDGKCIPYPTKIGNNILCYGRRKSMWPFHCHIGPDWPGVICVYLAILCINGIVLGVVSPLGWPVTLIGGTGCLALLYSYSVVALSDPGVVYIEPVNERIDDISGDDEETHSDNIIQIKQNCCHNTIHQSNIISKQNLSNSSSLSPSTPAPASAPRDIPCDICQITRPVTASHCGYCKACIHHLDHHCPWCGKCIGKQTKWMFYCFIGILQCQCYFLIGTFLYYVIAIYLVASWPKGPEYK